MKQAKMLMLLTLVLLTAGMLVQGCTGDGIYDIKSSPTVSPTPTASPTPTSSPTSVLTPAREMTQVISGVPNIFTLAVWGNSPNAPFVNGALSLSTSAFTYNWSEDLYWLESTSSSQGKFDKAVYQRADYQSLIYGLNNPLGLLMSRKTTDSETTGLTNNEDYVYISDTTGSDSGQICRYTRTKNGINQLSKVQLVSGRLGYIPYMSFPYPDYPYNETAGNIYYVVNSGNSSTLERIQTSPATAPQTPETLMESMEDAHSLYVYNQYVPDRAKDPDTLQTVTPNSLTTSFVFVTESIAGNGKIDMYNVNNSNVEPGAIVTGQDKPMKMTFIPDIQEYVVDDAVVYGHTLKPAGYLYWTSYDATSGEVMRVRLEVNDSNTNLVVKGSPQTVASGLRKPYDIIGPDNFRYLNFAYSRSKAKSKAKSKGSRALPEMQITQAEKYNTWHAYEANGVDFFKKIYVSSNYDAANNGNWYEVNTSKFNGTSMELSDNGSSGVKYYLNQTAQFPFNGAIQVFLIVSPGDNFGKVFKQDLYFTGYNLGLKYTPGTSGNSDGSIYVDQNTFNTAF